MHLLAFLKSELDRLAAQGRKPPYGSPARVLPHARVELQGKELLNFCSWDYFDLGTHPAVRKSAHHQIESSPFCSSSSRNSAGLTGTTVNCERRIAEFFGRESALLFSSRNQVVLSLLAAVADENSVIFYDEIGQAPFADAAFLVNAEAVPYSIGSLPDILSRSPSSKRRVIAAESLSPITGVPADLALLATIARRQEALIILDESWAIGSLGLRGAGLGEIHRAEVESQLLCIIGDLSLGLSGYGGCLAGPKVLTDFIQLHSKTLSNECPLPDSLQVAIETALGLVELRPLSREAILRSAARLRRGLGALGVLLPSVDSPIVALPFQRGALAGELKHALFQRGILVEALSERRPLSDSAVVRFIVREIHSEQQIDFTLETLSDVLPRIK